MTFAVSIDKPRRSCARPETHAIPANKASQPQCLPMTSTTKAREWELAVDEIESTASQILCRAVNPPMVKSVMAMSLL